MYYLSFPITVLAGICFVFQSNVICAQSKTEVLKTETCWSYTIENNLPATSGSISMKIEYDDQGKKTKETNYKKDGSITSEYFFDYSENARETYWKLSDGTKVKSKTERYNDDGQLLECLQYSTEGKLHDKIKMTYLSGEKTKEVYFNESNEIIYTVDYIHNKEKKTIRELYTTPKGDERKDGAVSLDSSGLPESYKKYAATGPLIQEVKYTRDEDGRVLVKETYAADKSLESKEVFEYTENAKHYSIYAEEGTKLYEHVIYKYNYYQNK
jgi:hypothetical protein